MDWLAVIHADNLVTIYIAAFHINSLLAIDVYKRQAWGWGCILKRYCFCANSRNTNMILTNWICWPISGEMCIRDSCTDRKESRIDYR